MPYNTAPLPPRREPTGTTQLPLSRVRKMISVDQDNHNCSSAASFAITLATEMFIQYLAEQGHNVVKSERKPRRNIQYRDLSSAISRLDNLEFLVDVVPKTIPFKEIKEKKAPAGASKVNGEGAIEAGQMTLDGKKPATNGVNGGKSIAELALVDADDADPNAQLQMESRGARLSGGSTILNGERGSRDVEMS